MTIEQAIDIFDDNYTVIDTHGHYTDEEVEQARVKAIKSLEMWDKVIDELEKELKEYDNVITDLDYATGVGYALEVIKECKKEIEE